MTRRACARAVLSLPILVLPFAACGGPPPASVPGSEAAADPASPADGDVCRAAAEVGARCGDAHVEAPAWERQCRSSFGPVLSLARPDYAAAVATCTRELECDAFLHQGGPVPCFRRAEQRLTPSPTAREFCERSLEKGRACRQGSVMTEAMCLRRYRAYRDDVLRAGTDCAALACTPWDGCLKRAVSVDRGDLQAPL